MSRVQAGVAVIDVTPAVGTWMSGFVARTGPSTGAHDPITVRAVCVDDTAIVAVDVVGLHEDFCAAVARGTSLPSANVRVHATHTHGSPASVVDRLGGNADPAWLESLEQACVAAVEEARRTSRPARVLAGYAAEVDVAHNRRRTDGPVDRSVPVVHLVDEAGDPIAIVVSYACHPVVLGADNTLLTADYPGVVRRVVEAQYAGAVALFLTGCAGDANTGHAASASVSLQSGANRTFADAEAAGTELADAVIAAELHPVDGNVTAAVAEVTLTIDVDPQFSDAAAEWRAVAADPEADTATTALMQCWVEWADKFASIEPSTWQARVGLLRWGGVRIVTLPGEPFTQTGLDLRATFDRDPGITIVAGYTDGCPGYLPTTCEYHYGGYEVAEAHRYYGLPGPFAAGSAERLAEAVTEL
ncbi:neutral/alkaline ceramidase-like enzyme [Kribbella amoyensis]|uniref:Neutral/alkaline ceramidase-like enzyme n=1 Tax=Kribbella amoyensis TaxID=996641 RepID=A0A561BMV1_9ACTN|nr:neutral/alkaline non-lysosomal ceramidase N-terminal domain-containing protein [Kribbella amoyensis]TWD80221.1 neutral/alkaline ceramidase-like enzyme [Kribbella amoyensis]